MFEINFRRLVTPAHTPLIYIFARERKILQNVLFIRVITLSFVRKIIPKRWIARTHPFIRLLISGGKNSADEDLEKRCRISLYLDREGDPHVRTRLRYYVFASKLKVLRYVVRAKDAGVRVEMWVILHAYAHSCTRGSSVSECPNDLVIRSRRVLAS